MFQERPNTFHMSGGMLTFWTFPLLINICLDYPTFLYVYKKNVNICEVDVSSLDFKVDFKLGLRLGWV
jgi:hypothetical protein